MCDYSLMSIPNRVAVSGDDLVVHRFEAGSVGLASAFDLRRGLEQRKAQSHGFWSKLNEFFNPPGSQTTLAVYPTRCSIARTGHLIEATA
jgi:hypothetical protein